MTSAVVALFSSLGGNAHAEKCEMTGEWIDPAPKPKAPPPPAAPPKDPKAPAKPEKPKEVPPKEVRTPFVFTADYRVPKQGAHEFTGRYINPTSKTAADVKGLQTDGTWVITLTYTNDANKGHTLKAIGEGQYQPPNVTINGTYKQTDATAKITNEGKFTMSGTCTK